MAGHRKLTSRGNKSYERERENPEINIQRYHTRGLRSATRDVDYGSDGNRTLRMKIYYRRYDFGINLFNSLCSKQRFLTFFGSAPLYRNN